jgi:hypothetical protein
MKDWKGNGNSIFKNLGASNHVESEREENDYYATDPKAIEMLLQHERFNKWIWECACGEKHLSDVLVKHNYIVKNSDIVNRGNNVVFDFLSSKNTYWDGDIITNPPYKYATEFVYKALDIIPDNRKVAMFMKLLFCEGKERKKLFEQHPPRTIYVFSSRIKCAKNGDFESIKSSAVCYAWFVWEKGYKRETTIKWL